MVVHYKQGSAYFPYTNQFEGFFSYRDRYYDFEAVCFAEKSLSGINHGNVVKLIIKNAGTGKLLLAYDNGHQIGDIEMYKRGMAKEVIERLSSYVTAVPLQKRC